MARGLVYEDPSVGWRQMVAADLPASGVGAGTYGDATHVAQVTVNAEGQVTAAADVAIAAGSGITALASPTATITVTNPSGPTADVDLPTTGVGAGTYGDATHVAEVTVDARGRVTSAASVPISGAGGAGGLIVLYDSGYLGADAASIDTGAGGVAAGHFCIVVYSYLRCSTADVRENVNVRFNNDATASYDSMRQLNVNGSISTNVFAGSTVAHFGTCPAANDAANNFGALRLDVPAYDGTANHKSGIALSAAPDTTGANNANDYSIVRYRSTSAISQLAITPGTAGQNFKAGSRMIIYGTQ